MMHRKIAGYCGAIFVALLAMWPQCALSRELAWQDGQYRLFLDQPQFCTLILSLDRDADLRLAYDRGKGAVYFSYSKPGFPQIPVARSLPVMLEFDASGRVAHFAATGSEIVKGRPGFMFRTDTALLERWSRASRVDLMLNDGKNSLIDQTMLPGSANAISQLTSCTLPDYSVTVAPPPPPVGGEAPGRPSDTILGELTVRCRGDEARSTYMLGQITVGAGLRCGADDMPDLESTRTFPSGEQIAIISQSISMTAGAASVLRLKRGEAPKIVNLDHIGQVMDVIAPNRIRVGHSGQLSLTEPRADWLCEVTIDWTKAQIVAVKGIGGAARMCTLALYADEASSATKASPAPAAPAAPSFSQWLVGFWVAKGHYCASGAPWIFRADGSAGDEAYEGRWEILDGKVVLRLQEVTLGDETSTNAPFKKSVHIIKRLGNDEMLWGADRLKRCPPNGGTEPWHPNETFRAQ